MVGVIGSLAEVIQERLARLRNRPFLEGVMAASAIVATADGEVNFAEHVRVDQILQTLDQLKAFDPHEGVELFKAYSRRIVEHPKQGHDEALKAIVAVGNDPEIRALLLRICLAISGADGQISMTEQIEIVSLCSRLGIDPSDCGLYIDQSVDEFLQAVGRPQPTETG